MIVALLLSLVALPCLDPVSAEDAVELNARAIEHLEAERFEEAIGCLERARELSPDDDILRKNLAVAHNNYGVWLLERMELSRAIFEFETAHRLAEENPRYLIHLGEAHLRRWDFTRAEATLLDARRRFPDEPEVLDHLGDFYYVKDELSRAIEVWEARQRMAESPAVAARLERARREQAVAGEFTDRSSNDFTLKFLWRSGGAAMADQVLRILEDARATVCSDLGFFPVQRTIVLLYGSQQEFLRATGAHAWVGGLYDGRIRLAVRDLERQREAVARTARHEYTHRVLHEMAPGAPIWLNEGLAEWFERGPKASPHERILDLLRSGRKPPAMAELGNARTFADQSDADQAALSYAASYSFTGFLMERFGLGAIRRFLYDLRANRPLDEAMKRNFGGDLSSIESLWRREILRP